MKKKLKNAQLILNPIIINNNLLKKKIEKIKRILS